ncbi:MAG: T9SS type A sorting domain-containing protein [Bacteroidota bacterium]
MKKIYFLLFFCFGVSLNAQIISIPDANFKAKLLSASPNNYIANNGTQYIKIDSNNNGEIEVSEAQQVVNLYVNNNYGTLDSDKIADLTGIAFFTNMVKFRCYYNKVTVLNLANMPNLYEVDFSNNLVATLNFSNVPQLFKIDGDYNQLTVVDLSTITSLHVVKLEHNLITSYNCSGQINVTELWLSSNQLATLNVTGMTNLQNIIINDNILTSLIFSNSQSITTIHCQYNNLGQLDFSGLSTLVNLSVGSNNLTSLNVSGLTNLTYFLCNYNQLTSLDVGASTNLYNFICSGNLITSLDLTGLNNLHYLDCQSNQLQTLILEDKPLLDNLFCNHNSLLTLDIRDLTSLNSFDCSYNNLHSLFIKNGVTQSNIIFNNNPNLQYICADEAEITAIQTLINNNNLSSTCTTNSYCSFKPGGAVYIIHGSEKIDLNSNGCDATDIPYPNLKFSVSGSPLVGVSIANASGNYSIPMGGGNYTITPIIENPSYFSIFPTNKTVSFPTQASPVTGNFCITPNGVHQDAEITLLPLTPARPGFNATYKLIFKNKGNVPLNGTINLTFNDAVLDLVTVNPMTSNQSTNTISWNYANLLPFEVRVIELIFNVNSPMETPPVNIGDQLDFEATINPILGDEIPIDNKSSLKQIVVGSLDPNDKRCIEGTIVGTNMIGQYVHYIIRFENTGTFAAENIVVKDVIDLTKFDINSLVPINGSHSFVTRISYPNKVEFIFENINLPFDDANNDGYVSFKIKTKSTLVVGNTFSNAASIYFDYNFPIVTNTSTTTIQTLGNSDFVFSNYFTLAPNPAKDILNIQSSQTIEIKSLSIYNTLGQLVLIITEPSNAIDVSNLKTGSYFIKVNSDKGTSSSNFLKE